MDSRYFEMLDIATSINKEIFAKHSTELMYGGVMPESTRKTLDKNTGIIGGIFDILIDNFNTPFTEENGLVKIKNGETEYVCPKSAINYFLTEKPFDPSEWAKPEDNEASPLDTTKETFANNFDEPEISVKEEPTEEAPLSAYDLLKNEPVAATDTLKEETNDINIDFSQFLIKDDEEEAIESAPVEESPVANESEIDFSQFLETPANTPEEPKEELIVDSESESPAIDFSKYLDDTTENTTEDTAPSLEVTDAADTSIGYSSMFNESKTETPVIEAPNSLFDSPVTNEFNMPKADNNNTLVFEEETTDDTQIDFSKYLDEPEEEVKPVVPQTEEFKPEARDFSHVEVGLAHSGDVKTTYVVPGEEVIYTILETMVTGPTGRPERMPIMIAPTEIILGSASVPIVVSCFYGGRYYTKASIESRSVGQNLIRIRVADYEFLVRGSFSPEGQFSCAINTTGKSIQDKVSLECTRKETFGHITDKVYENGKRYNGLYFHRNEEKDYTNFFIYPLSDKKDEEFVIISQSSEFIDYPVCSKSVVGTDKIYIDNNGEREELSVDWDNNSIKATITEVTYG